MINKKHLEKIISNNSESTTLNLFDVRSRISAEKTSALAIFMVDSFIYTKHTNKVDQSIKTLANDFKEYFKSIINTKQDPIILGLIIYSYSWVSDIISLSIYQIDELLNELHTKTKTQNSSIFNKGEIQALNKLSELTSEQNNEQEVFVFHFCGPESEDSEIYVQEFDQCIRKLEIKYEIIYLEKKNEKFESRLSEIIHFDTIELGV
jgi:hypothetical protein